MSDTPTMLPAETDKRTRPTPPLAEQDSVNKKNGQNTLDRVTHNQWNNTMDGVSNADGISIMNFVPVLVAKKNAKGQVVYEIVRMTHEEYALYQQQQKKEQTAGKTETPSVANKSKLNTEPSPAVTPVNNTSKAPAQQHHDTLPVLPANTAPVDSLKHQYPAEAHVAKQSAANVTPATPVHQKNEHPAVIHNAAYDADKKVVHTVASATSAQTAPAKKPESLFDSFLGWAAQKWEGFWGTDAAHQKSPEAVAATTTGKHPDVDLSSNVPYVTQYDSNVKLQSGAGAGPGSSGCYNACLYMGNQAGANPVPGWGGIFMGAETVANSFKISPVAGVSKGLDYINAQLDKKHPVIVGVGRQVAGYEGSRSGADKDAKGTDHFLVIVGRTTDAKGVSHYRFYDPGAYESLKSQGSAAKNILSVDSQGLLRGKSYGAEMVVSYVALNGAQ